MEWSIGKRIKSRSRERLNVVNKRKKMEAGDKEELSYVKKQRKRKGAEADFLEDLTPAYTNNVPAAQVTDKSPSGLRMDSQQDKSVKESFSRVFRDLEFGKSVATSCGLRNGSSEQNIGVGEKVSASDGVWNLDSVPSSSLLRGMFEQNTNSVVNEIWDLDLEKSVPVSSGLRDNGSESRKLDVNTLIPREIQDISSDSESESKVKASAKKKLFEQGGRIVASISDDNDDTSETEDEDEVNQRSEDNNTKDKLTVESLSSEDSSSSSSSSSSPSSSSSSSSSSSLSDEDSNSKEVIGDTDDDDHHLRKSPVKRVLKRERRPLGRSASCLTKPRKEVQKTRKLNRREIVEVEKVGREIERVNKPQSNAVFVCTHCGKENTGIRDSHSSFNRQQALRDDIEEINNFGSSYVSRYEDSVSINSEKRPELENPETGNEIKTPESPFTSRPETVNTEKAKEVQIPEKSSTSRLETLYIERAKEVQAPEKPSTSRPLPAPEKPFTSRPEAVDSEKVKEVQAPGLVLKTSEPVEVESDSSSSAGESGYESEASLKDKEVKSSNTEWRMLDGSRKEVDLFRLLVNSVWQKGPLGGEDEEEEDNLVPSPDNQSEEEDQRIYDDEGLLIIRPPPLIERFGVEEPETPPEMSGQEREEEKLWEELAFYLNPNNVDMHVPSEIESEITIDESPAALCKKGKHELYLDIEIGLMCTHCCFVDTEIRNMDASEWGEKNTSGRRRTDRDEEEGSSSFVGKLGFEAPNRNSPDEGCVSSLGTVWDKIPGVKSQMYPHQQEGFEFIWRNLAGTIKLNELKNFENSDETGGCIMSHAPGTGKTRLTITFLQSYLSCFPNCKAVIIAPASLLLTWAEEFKKWKVGIPFHNLGSLEFSGMESKAAVDILMQKNSSARSYNEIRMVKIYSWIKAKSILGISYNLYEKLAGVKVVNKKTKRMKPDRELDDIRKILMGMPGLLVLDEAHTPRNQRSCIWKTLSKVETQKRILLSGTPFQNNFQELCNVLGLARPKYLERLTATLKKSGMTVTKRGKKSLVQEINNRGIEELKTVMLPFVHVHKGSILQKSLPGLRECVVVLNPPELQKRVLESIEVTHNSKIKNVFETEHKLSLVSVHPSLVSRCKLTAKEQKSIDEALLEQLKKVRLDPNQSVKTRFLMEFITFCEVMKEKVLVFSQYIDPLKLIKKHLVSRFNWKEDVEVLYMHGKLEQKQRQTLINEFNDPKSKAKVMLASTKACSEGINLIGASRVVLLDVVWNPAVERQAISRAYRIGQQRIVYTYHLVAKGTPEGPKYCKQAHKDRISELVFACSKQEKGKEKVAEAMIEDKVLDTMVQHRKLGDMFDNLIIQPKEADLVDGFNILMP